MKEKHRIIFKVWRANIVIERQTIDYNAGRKYRNSIFNIKDQQEMTFPQIKNLAPSSERL